MPPSVDLLHAGALRHVFLARQHAPQPLLPVRHIAQHQFTSNPPPHQSLGPGYRPLRRSTADLALRAEVSQKAWDRYGSALAAVDDTSTLE